MRPGAAFYLLLCSALPLTAQVTIAGKVVDENSRAVAGVRVELRLSSSAQPRAAISDVSGNFAMALEESGDYLLRAERQGFYLIQENRVRIEDGVNHLAITLNHLQEFSESVDVTYSPPAIDLAEPSERRQLDNVEILTVPYPAPQDLRNSLPLFNGVVKDSEGQLHVDGGGTEQTNFTLDGFNVSDPVTGQFDARINIETVQSLDLQTSRYSASTGRGSAGSVDIKTKMGDDRWRFGGTNFIPGVSNQNGLHVNKWTPRVEVSGPIARGRAWFHNGFDAFYDVDTIAELPRGQNRASGLTTSNLTRLQVNLTPANILTASALINYVNRRRTGLSFLDPAETTTNLRQDLYMVTLKDQAYFGGGLLAEFGFAGSRAWIGQTPQGNRTYQITPFGSRGNYYVNMDRHTAREQWTANVYLPAFSAGGSHQAQFGVDLERDAFHQATERHPYEVLRTDMTLARFVTFAGNNFRRRENFSGAHYVQDRWTVRDGLLIEGGLRTEWDQIARQLAWSPRLSFAYAPKWLRETKLAGGIGIFHDALNLGSLTLHQDQVSYSTFYSPAGTIDGVPVETAFLVNEHDLRVPRYRTVSFSVERKLPFDLYGKAAFTHKTGSRGWMFINQPGVFDGELPDRSLYLLTNSRRDRYDATEWTVRRTFAGQFEWFAGYTRSSARSNAVVDYSIENPIFAPQAPGPFPWDAPNRFITWGWAPLPKRMLPRALRFLSRETNAAYLVEYHTGFPFGVVNESGVMVGAPNSRRVPSYFNINLHFERKFRFMHYLWAWRFGFNNITNSGNPNVVNNNVDSPTFLTYGRGQLRAFSVRLRLLGRR